MLNTQIERDLIYIYKITSVKGKSGGSRTSVASEPMTDRSQGGQLGSHRLGSNNRMPWPTSTWATQVVDLWVRP